MNLRAYLSMLVTASVLSAVFCGFVGTHFSKPMRYLCALICILLVCSPLKEIDLSSVKTDFDVSVPDGKGLCDYAFDKAEEEICACIRDRLFEETGIQPTSVRIDWDRNASDPVITGITLRLPDGTDETPLLQKAQSLYGVPITVERGDVA